MSTESNVIRADHNPKFYTRFLLMGIGAFAVMGWFLYDGVYAWPLQRERYLAYKELVDANEGAKWEALAEERGWSTDPPEDKHNRTETVIQQQFYWAAGCGVIGVLLLLKVFSARGSWIEGDGSKIATSWGQAVPFNAVTKVEKKNWANKGLAYVTYVEGDKQRRFTIDDLKFQREPTDAILHQLEQAIGEEKIVGGAPEKPPAEPAEG
ncbi:MAG: hypothetical protein AAGB00_13370 [Planctomycetota bacterium]